MIKREKNRSFAALLSGSALALKRFDRMAELFPSALEKAAGQLVYSGYPEAEDLKKMIQLHGGCSHTL